MTKIILGGGAVLVGCLLVSGIAFAYSLGAPAPVGTATSTISAGLHQAQQLMGSTSSLPAAPSWFSDALNSIEAWFQSIMAQGAQSTGAPVIPSDIAGQFTGVTGVAQNLFAQFDAWLYGIIHFHVAIIFNFLFGLIDWILSMARNVVDWLNSIFRSAARR